MISHTSPQHEVRAHVAVAGAAARGFLRASVRTVRSRWQVQTRLSSPGCQAWAAVRWVKAHPEAAGDPALCSAAGRDWTPCPPPRGDGLGARPRSRGAGGGRGPGPGRGAGSVPAPRRRAQACSGAGFSRGARSRRGGAGRAGRGEVRRRG